MSKLYLRIDVYLQKVENAIYFVDGEDSETICREDLYFISRGFRVPQEVLEIWFDFDY